MRPVGAIGGRATRFGRGKGAGAGERTDKATAGLTSDPRVSAAGPETRRRPEKLGLAAARAAEAW